MLFVIGSKVKLLKTHATGTVLERLADGMVLVRLDDDGFEIPVFEDDLARIGGSASPVKARVIHTPDKSHSPDPAHRKVETQYTILNATGLQMAFVPTEKTPGVVESYDLHLINDTLYEAVVSIGLYFNESAPIKWDGKLPGTGSAEIGAMPFDHLNQSPEIELTLRWVTTEMLTDPCTTTLKLKPKTFFKNVKTAPLLNTQVHLFKLADAPRFDEDKKQEDLVSYTRRHTRSGYGFNPSTNKWVEISDSKAFADFRQEIDLHIERLRPNAGKLSNTEILRIQLSAFEKFIEEAIRLGVERVFVIHGIGKGKLRDEIATRLLQMPHIRSFKNEYHPRYGWGATEVEIG